METLVSMSLKEGGREREKRGADREREETHREEWMKRPGENAGADIPQHISQIIKEKYP